MDEIISLAEACDLLDIGADKGYDLMRKDAAFPPVLLKTFGGYMFNRQAVEDYVLAHKKGFLRLLAQQAICGQCWPFYQPE